MCLCRGVTPTGESNLFSGATSLNLDAKGRIAMPSKHRDALVDQCAGKLVVTIDQDECLIIYPYPKWEEIVGKLEKAVGNDEALVEFKRLFVGNSNECDMDAQGRISIPLYLREWAGLEKRAALVGQIYKFELWNEDVWNARNKKTIEDKKQGRLHLPQEVDVAI